MQSQAHNSSAHFTDKNTAQNLGCACVSKRKMGLNVDPSLLWVPRAMGMSWNYLTSLQAEKGGFKVILT